MDKKLTQEALDQLAESMAKLGYTIVRDDQDSKKAPVVEPDKDSTIKALSSLVSICLAFIEGTNIFGDSERSDQFITNIKLWKYSILRTGEF